MSVRDIKLTAPQARRIAVAAQGFTEPKPGVVTRAQLRRLISRIQVLEWDSVSVAVRAYPPDGPRGITEPPMGGP